MRVVYDLIGYTPSERGAVVTIGAYDGVHLGHQAVLRLVRELATARDLEAVCLTFDRHPAEVVRPESAPKVLTPLDQKLELLDETGFLDTACVLTFDEARSREPAEEFVREVLVDGLGARVVVVGADFHFGHRRHGSVRLLEQMGAELHFEVVGLGLVTAEGDSSAMPYSSTKIREVLAAGAVAAAARMLGRPPRPYEVRGTVETRDKGRGGARGRSMNVAVPEQLCVPADGVYDGTIVAADGVERAATIALDGHPGPRGRDVHALEVHVDDPGIDIDGPTVKIRFVDRRPGGG